LAGRLGGMTGARRCPDGAEQLPLAPSIEGGAADALCLAGPRVRRHFPPPLLILVQAGQISPAPVWDTRVVDAGGGEAIHTATMWVTYPSYGYFDQPPEIRDRSRCAALGQRPDATERPDVQNAPVRTTTKMCRLPQSLTWRYLPPLAVSEGYSDQRWCTRGPASILSAGLPTPREPLLGLLSELRCIYWRGQADGG